MKDPKLFEGFVFDSSLPDGPVDLLHLSVEADDFPTADRIAVERASALVDALSYITKSAWVVDHHSSMIVKADFHPLPKIFTAAKLRTIPDDLLENTKEIKSYDGNALSLYRQALAARSALEKYLNFYRVLELCIGETDKIETWIKRQQPNIPMVGSITAITDMRNQVAHAKRNRAYAILSKVAHVNHVEALLVEVEALARKAIEESGES